MVRVNVLVEGYTEFFFIRDNLAHFLSPLNIFIVPILLKTSKQGRGGVTTYAKIQNQVKLLCKKDSSSYVTTLLDYYRLPSKFPGTDQVTANMNLKEVVSLLEQCFADDISMPNQFIPNLMVHEFEALLFSDVSQFKGIVTDDNKMLQKLLTIRNQFITPEDINNSYETAPSKRLEKIFPYYNKVVDGNQVAEAIGLDKIRQECQHFDRWINTLLQLSPL